MTNKDTTAPRERLGGRREQFDVPTIAEALRQAAGVISLAAARLKISRTALYQYFDRHPELHDVRREIEEETLDLAEAGLLEQIRDKNMTALIFYLKTKGKQRGYVERSEVTGPNGRPVSVQVSADNLSVDDALRLEELAKRAANPQPAGA
ncbi:helix-turn-helix domain-containing protein [Chelatococcus asaccharovorans]|uniref:Regulatory Fis family protein n=1 Tax=Chelatococcus asaccharovorans TaxID=28210 RepID=A0A2V3UAX6_9HYPH|nr:helix-turn-helix domain-containing protein [Chelatococcus asaccharovorans]MBS7703301.1 hypothetical protein [Chelatococcus asaccharovorans]PXW61635.1 regulatory Fis family protein [Chelatococcus asaccharovorans]